MTEVSALTSKALGILRGCRAEWDRLLLTWDVIVDKYSDGRGDSRAKQLLGVESIHAK